MANSLSEQLDKILALADSSHDGEAVVAVRKARQILSRDGLSFGDLARAASSRRHGEKPSGIMSFLSGQRDDRELRIQHLRQQVEDLQTQLKTQDLQIDFWRRRARDLEQGNQVVQTEAERWKKLARDTAEQLWDIGQSIRGEEFMATESFMENAVAGKKK